MAERLWHDRDNLGTQVQAELGDQVFAIVECFTAVVGQRIIAGAPDLNLIGVIGERLRRIICVVNRLTGRSEYDLLQVRGIDAAGIDLSDVSQ